MIFIGLRIVIERTGPYRLHILTRDDIYWLMTDLTKLHDDD